jgi:hypothetical protein
MTKNTITHLNLKDIDTFYISKKPYKKNMFKLVCGIHIDDIPEFFYLRYIDITKIKISLIFPINEYRHNFEPLGCSENYIYIFLDLDALILSKDYSDLMYNDVEARSRNSSLEKSLNEYRLKTLESIEKIKNLRKDKKKTSLDTFVPYKDGFERFNSGCPKTEIKFSENIPFCFISNIYADMLYMKQLNRSKVFYYKTLHDSVSWKITSI